MRLKTLAVAVLLAACSQMVYAADEDGIPIRGPGGISRPEPVAVSPHTNAVPLVRPSRHGPNVVSPRHAQASARNTGAKVGIGGSGSSKVAATTAPAMLAVTECIKPKLPDSVSVDKPVVPRFSLTATDGEYTITNGENLLTTVNFVRPNSSDDLDDWQILAAIVRENPESLGGSAFIPGKNIRVPSVDRMHLETSGTGQTVQRYASDKKLNKLKLPDLELPWAAEDARIAEQQKKHDAVEAERTRLTADYDKCLAQKEAALKLANDSSVSNANANGNSTVANNSDADKKATEKSLVALYEKMEEARASDRAELEAQNKKLQEELDRAREENAHTNELLNQTREENARTNELLGEVISELKKKPDVQAEPAVRSTADDGKDERKGVDDENLIYIISGVGTLLLLAVGGFAFMRLKRSKLRRALIDDESDIDVDDPLPEAGMESVFPPVAPEVTPNNSKSEFESEAVATKLESDDREPTSTDLGVAKNNLDSKKDEGLFPDLDNPDEGIPDNAVRLDIDEQGSPDLVPSRHMDAELGDLDEAGFQESIKSDSTDKTSSEGEAKASDADVMDEWAAALAESKEAPKDEAKDGATKSDAGSDKPASDADVMDEWAAALAESKEAPKDDAKDGATKSDAGSDKPASDADVMDEWAAALAESKEAPKDDAKDGATKSDAGSDKPASDADVMDEWAAALAESKEAPKDEAKNNDAMGDVGSDKPASDADVMDEWAAALAESKETPKDEAKGNDVKSDAGYGKPASDAEVMDEWAAALAEFKDASKENLERSQAKKEAEANKPASDADVMDEWAAALAESKEKK